MRRNNRMVRPISPIDRDAIVWNRHIMEVQNNDRIIHERNQIPLQRRRKELSDMIREFTQG